MKYHVKAVMMHETLTGTPMGYAVAILDENERVVSHGLCAPEVTHDQDWKWPVFETPEEAIIAYENGIVSDPDGKRYLPFVKQMITEGEPENASQTT